MTSLLRVPPNICGGPQRSRLAAQVMLTCFLATLLLMFCPASAQSAPVFNPANLQVSVTQLSFYAEQDGSTPISQLFKVFNLVNLGTQPLNWAMVANQPWIYVSTPTGSLGASATASVSIAVDATQATVGAQTGTVTIWDTDAVQSLFTLTVFFRVCQATCVSANVSDLSRVVPPELFGSQIDWLNDANGLWGPFGTTSCTDPAAVNAAPVSSILAQIPPLGVRLLRYPSGIPADFFHWSQAIGPVTSRLPQIDPWNSSPGALALQCPVFGPDEEAELAQLIGAEILTTANVGTGTAQEAASWLTHDMQQGFAARYWEIGNEVYIPGIPPGDPNGWPYFWAADQMSPSQYATAFDGYAQALRAVDPTVKVGVIATSDSSTWNPTVFGSIQQRADFIAIHLLQPLSCTGFLSDDAILQTLLATPALMTAQLDQVKQALSQFASDQNKNLDIAVTEHGAFFWCLDVNRNAMLASALFSALTYNVFLRDPRVTIANHANLIQPVYQAPLRKTVLDTAVQSAFYYVSGLYTQTVGGTVTGTPVVGSPTFSTSGLGIMPPVSDLPVLDATGVLSSDRKALRLFVVNRSLSTDVAAHVAFDALPGAIQSVTQAIVNGQSYTAANTLFTPNAVTLNITPMTTAGQFDMTFPAHSLVCFTVQLQ